MKTFISSIVLLGLGVALLSMNSNSFVVAETANSEEFIARGTEPFWSITVSKRGIIYSSPDVKKQTFPYVTPLKAEGRPANLLRVYRLRGRSNSLLIIKQVNSCSDGMSDKVYPYSATVILDKRVLEGCAEKK
ncbi:MAG: hypothetical protein KME32_27230 [Mojavia pulchra JT2-VF2]|jgi:uncharacterized membrane protein|uniref:Uncharacterized protein n=1 Tax=Mojavia pulchra JT2-VF2 TaxID=287848 RepID=A0A951UJ45_9NOST|nr:hypothetical protein [Mojavia pulchra JT2-VF2]